MKPIFFLLTFVIFSQAFASNEVKKEEAVKVMTLSQWRDFHTTEAQNRVVRLANRITLVRSTTGDVSEISRLEIEKKDATHSADLVRDFTIEDYFNMYLSQFLKNEAALLDVATSMSKEEVAELLKLLGRRQGTAVAGDSTSPILTGLVSPAAASPDPKL